MQRWIGERLDDAMLPLLKLFSPGYHKRLRSFRTGNACDLAALDALEPPSTVERMAEGAWQGYRVERYRFASPLACTAAHNHQVSGRLIWADQNAPWVLVVPGYATGAFWPYDYSFFQSVHARALLQHGINAALIDLPYHLSRKQPEGLSGEGFFSPDLAETQSAVLQAAADTVALLRWLRQESGRPVGLWGTSLGGCVAGLATTRMNDLAAVVLLEPLDNPGHSLAVLQGSKEIRDEICRHGLTTEAIPAHLKAVAPSTYPPGISRERILFITPRWDRVVPTRFQEAFWEAWGRPERTLVNASHTTTAANRTVAATAAEFLARWLLPA